MSTSLASTPPASPGNSYAAIARSNVSASPFEKPTRTVGSTRPRRTHSPAAGGCDFGKDEDHDGDAGPERVIWTAASLPSVVALTEAPAATRTRFDGLASPPPGALPSTPGEQIVDLSGAILRLDVDVAGARPPAVLLPLDRLFEVRLAAAQRLWRCLAGRRPNVNPAALSKARRDRFILALRALDGKQAGATHRQIAAALFGKDRVAGRAWISHDLRDRTARLVRLGVGTMKGGYLRLLLHPFRGVP